MTAVEPASIETTVVHWLDLLYNQFTEGWLTTFSVDRQTGERHTDWSTVEDYDTLADHVARRAPSSCVWFGVATRTARLANGARGGHGDCAAIPGLWVDIDIAGPTHRGAHHLPPDRQAAHELIAAFPLPPNVVVDTGGGLQPWWLLHEPCDNSDATPLLARWGATWEELAAKRGWHVDNVFDLARIMRLPGTSNRKTDQPIPVFITDQQGGRYGLDDLDQWLIEPPEPTSAPVGDRVPYIGPTRPGDAFNAAHTAGELLAATGWTLARTDSNGDQHWTRPGKETREGTSATVYTNDGHCTIWSTEAARQWPTLDVRRPYDPFGLLVHLTHAGDFTAASDDLEQRGYGTKARPNIDLAELIGTTLRPTSTPPTPHNNEDSEVGSSWQRTDLTDIVTGLVDGTLQQPQPTLGRFTSSETGLFYRGRVNGLYGEPGKGKTWIALHVATEVLADGGAVGWIDLEEPAPGLIGRLLDLGVTPDALVERFAHFAPEETIRHAAALQQALDQLEVDLVVIDSTGEALALEGYGPNNDDEVATWFRTWPRWLTTRPGAPGVIVIDHVIKDESSRGLWPGGSQRKKAAINGAAFMATPIKELGRGVDGRLKLVTSKDRQGHHRTGTKAGEFILDATGPHLAARLEEADHLADGETFRPTVLMERVSCFMEERSPEPASTNDIIRGVTGKQAGITKALEVLVDEGYMTRSTSGRGHLYRLVRFYREVDEMVSQDGDEDA